MCSSDAPATVPPAPTLAPICCKPGLCPTRANLRRLATLHWNFLPAPWPPFPGCSPSNKTMRGFFSSIRRIPPPCKRRGKAGRPVVCGQTWTTPREQSIAGFGCRSAFTASVGLALPLESGGDALVFWIAAVLAALELEGQRARLIGGNENA